LVYDVSGLEVSPWVGIVLKGNRTRRLVDVEIRAVFGVSQKMKLGRRRMGLMESGKSESTQRKLGNDQADHDASAGKQ
jgi:hypothetical protein